METIKSNEIIKKELVRIRLLNWHFFENETISLNGMTLVSGENTAGKSTILDAIQMVLTTNTKRFNQAANENSKRSLIGYVRCKVGNEGAMYLRKNTVPANVALEFYEEKGDRYFVLGVHLLSHDEESRVVQKWYCEECRLEDLSFIVDDRPALADEFKNKGSRVKYLDSAKHARDKFRHRLGSLDEKFFDIIPKALAFKPMDRVKEFINQFVLSDERIDIEKLRTNIETLEEFEDILEKTKNKVGSLSGIIETKGRIDEKTGEIATVDLMIQLAERDAKRDEIRVCNDDIEKKEAAITSMTKRVRELTTDISELSDRMVSLRVSIEQNEAGRLSEDIKRSLEQSKKELSDVSESCDKLMTQLDHLYAFVVTLSAIDEAFLKKSDIELLKSSVQMEEKQRVFDEIGAFYRERYPLIEEQGTKIRVDIKKIDDRIRELQEKQRRLNDRKLDFPTNVVSLRDAITREYKKRGITSSVYVLAELLEITDKKWTDAVEGYLNTQKFYIVTEPKYYDLALSVYDRMRNSIHSAGLINTKKLPLDTEADTDSLAYVVKSENRYATAYVNYVLGRVKRVDTVEELEKYDIAITPFCMLYQGYVARVINPAFYRDPYIGMQAYLKQIENTKLMIEAESKKRRELREYGDKYKAIKTEGDKVNIELIRLYAPAPYDKENLLKKQKRLQDELESAKQDPTLIELNMRLSEAEKEHGKSEAEKRKLDGQMAQLSVQAANLRDRVEELSEEEAAKTKELQDIADSDGMLYAQATEKYEANKKNKSSQKIAENFAPRLSALHNEKNSLNEELVFKQTRFNVDFSEDFIIGMPGIKDYVDAYEKLSKFEVVRYEEKVKQAREECEEIFRSDFLAKMKEHIENARNEFRSLNRALSGVYYGEDSYRFTITFDKKKEGLYRMITSDYNMGDNTIFTSQFEAEYREEMQDLFDKLMVHDDGGDKVVAEYTDYRSYLDYDIEIEKRSGGRQRFSEIYGEKSGSETQVPFYVAIAASFYQLYRYGNTVRLMLLDEAFDKMDDERIEPMLEFFRGLGLQVIMATPPGKIETIGEHADTILTAIRIGQGSVVDEYVL